QWNDKHPPPPAAEQRVGLGERKKHVLEKRLGSSGLADNGSHARHDVEASISVNGSKMRKKRLKSVAQRQIHVIPHLRSPSRITCGHAAQDVGFQDIVALQFLAAFVQDDEHLMCLVDVMADDDN